MGVSRLWLPRGRAYLRDCVGYLGFALLEVPLGLAVSGRALGSNPLFLAVASSVPPLAATMIAGRAEAGPAHATWGKRRESLQVEGLDGEEVGLSRALWRNAIKIALPWSLGHAVAFGAAQGGFDTGDPWTLTATVLTYVVVPATVLMGVIGTGRTLHDRLSGTRVGRVRLGRCASDGDRGHSVPRPAGQG